MSESRESLNNPLAIVSYMEKYTVPKPGHSSKLVADWVNECLNDHPECRDTRQIKRLKPSRVLYVDPDQTDIIKLIPVTEKDDYQYVTLSHRWGSPEPPMLTKFNNNPKRVFVGDLRKGLRITELPQTFRDAVDVTRRCGIKYLWIDSLCIIQDIDPEKGNQDWAAEAGKMADIYAGGVFNIAATIGRNSGAGLFPVQHDILLPVVPGMTGQGQAQVIWELPRDRFDNEIMSVELLSRGWVYQEVLLTPANLFCTADEMWWSCTHATCSETFPGGAMMLNAFATGGDDRLSTVIDTLGDRKTAIMPHNASNPMRAWMDLIQYYPETSITVSSDRLMAIAGIANLFRAQFPDKLQTALYHSGVWFSSEYPNALYQLLWHHSYLAPMRPHAVSYPVPSWSPMSCSGPIGFDFDTGDEAIPVEFVGVGSGDEGNPDKSEATGGRPRCILHLRGVLVSVDITCVMSEGKANKHGQASIHGLDDGKFRIHWDGVNTAARWDAARALAMTFDDKEWKYPVVRGLLLKPAQGPPTDDGRMLWERCGYFVFSRITDEDAMRDVWEYFELARYGFSYDSNSKSVKKDVSAQLHLDDIYIV
ncbi:hypothetical protein SLS53_003295 [Cytospora paraplurivora]|uniref:Heterokaryon incompatibility domain-containing protein n=1 Tax=Cytospora paraplurivora TaxID=2898453 RepID=A0AAN9UEV9_9PEZI